MGMIFRPSRTLVVKLFFMHALELLAVPSSPTLRQHLKTHAGDWFDLATQINQAFQGSRIKGQLIDFGALPCGYTPANPG